MTAPTAPHIDLAAPEATGSAPALIPVRRPWRRPMVTIAVIEQVTRFNISSPLSDGTTFVIS